MRAAYCFADDRLSWWPGRELSPSEYAATRGLGFLFWMGRQAWVTRWSPEAHDFLLECCGHIEEVRSTLQPVPSAEALRARIRHLEGQQETGRWAAHLERRKAYLREHLAVARPRPFA